MKRASVAGFAVLFALFCAPRPAAAQIVSIIVPSSARVAGANGAFYTTDLSVANTGATTAALTLKFLGHDQDGTAGPERAITIAPGATVTLDDVLGTVFSESSGFGAIRISSSSQSLVAVAQTSTPGFGGTFGQSVPGFGDHSGLYTAFIRNGQKRSIVAVREDGAFRTNLVLANATTARTDVDVTLVSADGLNLGSKRYTLPPLGMTQVSRVVREFGVSTDVSSARLDLSTPTTSGQFAAYASSIDNTTNDPRTLLPISGSGYSPFGYLWWVPSSARASGANGAFYTTDLTVSNIGTVTESFTLQFSSHDQSGGGLPKIPVTVAAGKTVTFVDVLGSVFGQSSAYGALQIYAAYTSATAGGSSLVFLAETSTPGFGGTFGQSVTGVSSSYIITTRPHSILGVREDSLFRTNLVLCNDGGSVLPVDVSLVAADGTVLGSKRYSIPSLGMTQVTRVVRDLGVTSDVVGARLAMSTPAVGTGFLAYASVIDNVTNDPRTLLPLSPYVQY